MPLPPAPTKPASRLTPEAMATTARKPANRTRRAAPTGDDATTISALPPTASQLPKVAEVALASAKSTAVAAPTPVRAATRKAKPAPTLAAAAPVAAPAPKARPQGPAKLFVLDTNVLLHDPSSLFRFEEHDIYLPMIVLEELDAHKKGMTEVARNGRQVSRALDALAAAQGADMGKGLKLDSTGQRGAGGSLFFQTSTLDFQLPTSLPQGKADNQILGVVEALRRQHAPREVVLVSKDINMRVKARALGLPAEDYQNDKALEDGDLLYSGALQLP